MSHERAMGLAAIYAGECNPRAELARALIAADERIKLLESAVRWALGYDEGPPEFDPPEDSKPRYWWRTELRRRAALEREAR